MTNVKPTGDESRPVALWLAALALLVLAMVVVGGATRLTGSGLSITQWQPLTGAVPPLSQAQWLDLFGRYQATPQYRLINRGMSLENFKFIFCPQNKFNSIKSHGGLHAVSKFPAEKPPLPAMQHRADRTGNGVPTRCSAFSLLQRHFGTEDDVSAMP